MDFLRAGEAILRSSQPLLPFLAPSAYRTPNAARLSRHYRPQQAQRQQACRAISTSQSRRQQNAAVARDSEAPPQSKQKRPSASFYFSALLDDALDVSRSSPGTKSLKLQDLGTQRAGVSRMQDYAPREGSSTDDILNMLDGPQPQQRQQQPASSTSTSSLFGFPWTSRSNLANDPRPPAPVYIPQESPVKLNSSVGRTIKVDSARGMDVGRAFRQLEIKCAQNSVRKDFMRQRFHERPGLKRKRLKSERWRKRFKEGFRGTVAMVKKMRAQGW